MSVLDPSEQRFVICIHNGEYPASLEVRKLYQVIPDPAAARHHFLRIIDESGEDYLYPEAYFVPIELPQSIRDALATAA
jgi:hypothetical protein